MCGLAFRDEKPSEQMNTFWCINKHVHIYISIYVYVQTIPSPTTLIAGLDLVGLERSGRNLAWLQHHLLGVSRKYGNIFYRDYIGLAFPYSLQTLKTPNPAI